MHPFCPGSVDSNWMFLQLEEVLQQKSNHFKLTHNDKFNKYGTKLVCRFIPFNPSDL